MQLVASKAPHGCDGRLCCWAAWRVWKCLCGLIKRGLSLLSEVCSSAWRRKGGFTRIVEEILLSSLVLCLIHAGNEGVFDGQSEALTPDCSVAYWEKLSFGPRQQDWSLKQLSFPVWPFAFKVDVRICVRTGTQHLVLVAQKHFHVVSFPIRGAAVLIP